MSRKALLVCLTVTAAATLPVGAQSPSPRESIDRFLADPLKLAALKRGVEVMKARDPSDPTSWFFQAAIHGVTDDAVAEALAVDPNVGAVDQIRFWNQCPHSGQPSADFLIWHRAYTFYFERILRAASGEATLSLPYWNYTDSAQRRLPQAFALPDTDPVTTEPRNPLFHPQRELAFAFGLYELTDLAVSTAAAFREKRFFGPDENSGFAGGVGDTNPRTQGLIEGSPHNMIHFAVGGAIGDTNGALAFVPTAAFDPVFWIHHSNVDRLWTEWECLPDRVWGTVPSPTYLAEKPWHFHDADLSVKNPSRLDYLTGGTVPIRYDSDDPTCQPLSGTPLVQPTPSPALAAAPLETVRREEIGRLERAVAFSAERPVTGRVELTEESVFGEESAALALADSTPARPRKLMLELNGLDYDVPPSVGFEVYVNLPTGADPQRSSPYFVGLIALFGLKHHHGHDAGPTQLFDITHLADMPGFDPDAVDITIVPFDLLRPAAGFPPLRRSGDMRAASFAVAVQELAAGPD